MVFNFINFSFFCLILFYYDKVSCKDNFNKNGLLINKTNLIKPKAPETEIEKKYRMMQDFKQPHLFLDEVRNRFSVIHTIPIYLYS